MKKTKYNTEEARIVDEKKADILDTFREKHRTWPISIGDMYGVYQVVEIQPCFKHPNSVNYATVSLVCTECNSILFKNYNTLKKQLNKGVLNKCKCFSFHGKDGLKDDPLFKKISQNIYEARQRLKNEHGFTSDPPKKIFYALSEDEKKGIDLTSDKYEYWIGTKDGTLNYIAGNITFKKVLKSTFVKSALSGIYVDPLYVDKRARVRKLLHKLEIEDSKSEFDVSEKYFLHYKRSSYLRRIKIGKQLGNLKIIGYLKSSHSLSGNKCHLECQKCGFTFHRTPQQLFLKYNYSCPKCSAGYLRYDNNRNSSNVRSRWDNDLVKLEVAAVECMSDFTRYSCVGTDLVELYLDSDTGEYTKSQFADVFGDSYF